MSLDKDTFHKIGLEETTQSATGSKRVEKRRGAACQYRGNNTYSYKLANGLSAVTVDFRERCMKPGVQKFENFLETCRSVLSDRVQWLVAAETAAGRFHYLPFPLYWLLLRRKL